MGYVLRISGEIRQWLADLCVSDPEAAAVVGQALVALMNVGPSLGRPVVVKPQTGRPGTDPREALDHAYQIRLERAQDLRHATAEAADVGVQIQARVSQLEGSESQAEAAELRELLPRLEAAHQRLVDASRQMQANADAFRMRKEILKARYTAAEAQDAVAGLFSEAATGLDDDELLPVPGAAGPGDARLQDIIDEIELELASEGTPGDLLELQPGGLGGPAGDIGIIFAVEPAGTALLISVLEGESAIRYQHADAVALSADVLRQVRAGQDADASAVGYAGAEPFLTEFFPANSADVRAGAEAIAARSNRGST